MPSYSAENPSSGSARKRFGRNNILTVQRVLSKKNPKEWFVRLKLQDESPTSTILHSETQTAAEASLWLGDFIAAWHGTPLENIVADTTTTRKQKN